MNQKLDSIYQNVKFTLLAHVFNPLWNSRLKRRRRRGKYSYVYAKHYLKSYLPFIKSINFDKPDLNKESGEDYIYSIWFQGEDKAPELVKVCFERLKSIYGDRVKILDNQTIWEWVSLPAFVREKWEQGKITPAHFSDICRVALLYQHGGLWFDATDYLTHKVPQWIEDSDLFIYLEGGSITPGTFIQSCFMRAKKGHPLFKGWLDFIFEYWKRENKLVHYFLLHYMLRFLTENNEQAKELFYKMPQINQDPTHILWHLHHKEPYTEDLYLNDTKDTFFQKTSFKRQSARNPIPGSVADIIIQRKGEPVKL